MSSQNLIDVINEYFSNVNVLINNITELYPDEESVNKYKDVASKYIIDSEKVPHDVTKPINMPKMTNIGIEEYLKKTISKLLESYHYYNLLNDKCKEFMIDYVYFYIKNNSNIVLNYHEINNDVSDSKSHIVHALCMSCYLLSNYFTGFNDMDISGITECMNKFHNISALKEYEITKTMGYNACEDSEDHGFVNVVSRIYDLCEKDNNYLNGYMNGNHGNLIVKYVPKKDVTWSEANNYIKRDFNCNCCGGNVFKSTTIMHTCQSCENIILCDDVVSHDEINN